MSIAVRPFDVLRVDEHQAGPDPVKLPFEVRLNSQPFSVIMRTPEADEHLALGFLLSESVIRNRADIGRIDLA